MLHIYLPKSYQHSRKHYPVLYMFDGHNLFFDEDATYGKCWGLKDYLDKHEIELIVVGIECNHEGLKRLSEFSPYDFKTNETGKINGMGKVFFKWMCDDLKPMIDQNYRTLRKRKNTYLGGSSMGGLMSLYGILHYNDVYSKAVCLSPTLKPLFETFMSELPDHIESNTYIYMSYGTYEFRNKKELSAGVERMFQLNNWMNRQQIQCRMHLVAEGRHQEASWEKEIPLFISDLIE